jgi:large conductance mechanosensitive channel
MMPIVGYFAGGIDFSEFKIILSEAVVGPDGNVVTPESAIRYGAWINSIINLVIVGFVLFLIVKSYNKVRVKEEAPAPEPKGPTQEELLAEIRDLLKKN